MLELIPYMLIVAIAGAAGVLCFRQATGLPETRHLAERIVHLERELEQARKQSAEACERRAHALSRLSHELRTPMNAILGFTELLLAGDLEDSQRKQVQMISESGRTMLRLLNDILDITRLENGKFRLVEEATELAGELQYCAELVEAGNDNHGSRIRLQIDPALPPSVKLDRIRLREVLLTLVGNAVKHSGGGLVALEAHAIDQDRKDGLEILVRDTGRGIGPERQAVLFEPFYSKQPGIGDEVARSGLAMPIARQVVRHMGGNLTVDSIPGLGSTFTIRLPLNAAVAEQHEHAASAFPANSPSPRVLVAEDNAINQQLILVMLRCLDIEADLVADSEEAIAAVARASQQGRPYRLVLMDVQMPGMDGLEATRQLRSSGQDTPALPIIALTANCLTEEVEACRKAGMQAHVAKPIRLSDLAEKLKTYIVLAAECGLASSQDSHSSAADNLDVRRTVFTASVSMAALEDKYLCRKQMLLEQVTEILAQDAAKADWERLLRELHRVAGTAANFGNADFGQLSRELGDLVRATPDPAHRQALLSQAYAQMRKAA